MTTVSPMAIHHVGVVVVVVHQVLTQLLYLFFVCSLIIQEGVRQPKVHMLSLTHLCDLMASFYEGCD